MNFIYHEYQDGGALCAQHSLNNLLQGNYFNAVDLSELAKQIDKEETSISCIDEKVSENYDDSGYFSIQVLSRALSLWDLEMVPLMSTTVAEIREDPAKGSCSAFISNYKDHCYLSDSYLSLFLAQLAQEGYSIFAIIGDLPVCDADMYFTQNPLVTEKKELADENDELLKKAILLSLTSQYPEHGEEMHIQDEEMTNVENKQVNEPLSIEDSSITSDTATLEEIRKLRLKYFDKLQSA